MRERIYDRWKDKLFQPKSLAGDQVTCIDINNIARMCLTEEGNPQGHIDFRKFPCLIPKWKISFMEFMLPRIDQIHTGTGQVIRSVPVLFGVKIVHAKIPAERQASAIAEDVALSQMRAHWSHHDQYMAALPLIDVLESQPISSGGKIPGHFMYSFSYFAPIDLDGIQLRSVGIDYLTESGALISQAHRGLYKTPAPNKDADGISGEIACAWYAVALTHCKNVLLVNEDIPEAVRKKRERKAGQPSTIYKQIAIRPFDLSIKKAAKEKSGASGSERKALRLHIVEGQFHDHRPPNKPLFGKYEGIWWWDQHVRGSAGAGQVVKEYKVE